VCLKQTTRNLCIHLADVGVKLRISMDLKCGVSLEVEDGVVGETTLPPRL